MQLIESPRRVESPRRGRQLNRTRFLIALWCAFNLLCTEKTDSRMLWAIARNRRPCVFVLLPAKDASQNGLCHAPIRRLHCFSHCRRVGRICMLKVAWFANAPLNLPTRRASSCAGESRTPGPMWRSSGERGRQINANHPRIGVFFFLCPSRQSECFQRRAGILRL